MRRASPRSRLRQPLSLRPRSLLLPGFRWAFGFGGLLVLAFWFVYYLIDPAYFDPLALRIAVGALCFACFGLTFVVPPGGCSC